MRVLQRGHRYSLKNRGGSETGFQVVQYVNREPGMECDGVTQQEVLRMMLDRNRYCTSCLPNSVSERIQYHLRMALALHEMRAIERKVQKGELEPEFIDLGKDGHFRLTSYDNMEIDGDEELNTDSLTPYKQEWEKECNHGTANDKVKVKFEDLDNDEKRKPVDGLDGSALEELEERSYSNKKKTHSPKQKPIILESRHSLDEFLNSQGSDIDGKRVDVNGSITHIVRAIRNRNPDDSKKVERYARMLYSLYKKRVSGNQPGWGLNGSKLALDPYYSGIRARAYVDAMELVFDYLEVTKGYLSGFDSTKNIITVNMPAKLLDFTTGDIVALEKFDCHVLQRVNDSVSQYEVYRDDIDTEVEINFASKLKYQVFIAR